MRPGHRGARPHPSSTAAERRCFAEGGGGIDRRRTLSGLARPGHALPRPRPPPATDPRRSMIADAGRRLKALWSDMTIDVQGPKTKSEGGGMCVLSCSCTGHRLSKLQARSISRASCLVGHAREGDLGLSAHRLGGADDQHGQSEVIGLVRSRPWQGQRLHAAPPAAGRVGPSGADDESAQFARRGLCGLSDRVALVVAHSVVSGRDGCEPRKNTWMVLVGANMDGTQIGRARTSTDVLWAAHAHFGSSLCAHSLAGTCWWEAGSIGHLRDAARGWRSVGMGGKSRPIGRAWRCLLGGLL